MRLSTLCLLSVMICACVPKPQKNYTPDEVARVSTLEELMRINADRADPLFAMRNQTQFTPEEMTRISNAMPVIEASAKQIATFAGKGEYDDGFAEFANKLAAAADTLRNATDDDSAAATSKGLKQMKSLCSGCHGVYK
jgi:hypothetical protein